MGNKLYYNYVMFCRDSSKIIMNNPLTPNSSDDEIRRYMLGEHNQNARQEIHRAIPYQISDPQVSRATSPEILQTLKQKGVVLPDRLEEIVILHAGLPVDTMTAEQLKQYLPNENLSVRQSAA